MGIQIYYEFDCEHCRCGEHPPARNLKRAKDSYRESGGIITADGKTYCSKKCYEKRNEIL